VKIRHPERFFYGKSPGIPGLFAESGGKLQGLLVGLNHLLDHLAADRTGLAGGQVAVIAFLQVDTNLP